jgi:hypothetical protein
MKVELIKLSFDQKVVYNFLDGFNLTVKILLSKIYKKLYFCLGKIIHMKKILVCLLSVLLIQGIQNQVKGQTGCLNCIDSTLNLPANTLQYNNLSREDGIQCNPNTFYAIANGEIEELQINGTNITSNGVVVPNGICSGLACLNNINGTPFSPTFYSHSGTGNLNYFDGTGWIATTCPYGGTIGLGGHNGLLYLANSDSIWQYNGIAISTLYIFNGSKLKIADIAVDSGGNVWCVIGPSTGTMSNSIVVISPSGQLVNQYSFSINTINAYGCFLLNGIFYIGFGGNNPVYPNTILPISFALNNAFSGIPLLMGTQYSLDLASCDPGLPVSLIEIEQKTNYTLFPIPVQNELHFSPSFPIFDYYIIYHLDGKVLNSMQAIAAGSALIWKFVFLL